MSDLLHRAEEARTHAGDLSEPKWVRVTRALKAFDGLNLTALHPDVAAALESELVAVNGVLSGCDIKEFEDYQGIDDADLQRVLEIVDSATERVIAMELDRLVAELDAAGNKLPVTTIHEIREHRERMVPRLIEVLRQRTAEARSGKEVPGNAQFFALFLLTEFQAKEALPAILEAVSLPGDLPYKLLGDAISSTLPRTLAALAADRLEVVDALIDNRALDEYVRWAAAGMFLHLVRDGTMMREEAVWRLQEHLRNAMEEKNPDVVIALVCELYEYAPAEAIDDIRQAYQRKLADAGMMGLKEVENAIAHPEEHFAEALARCAPTGIPDTIAELQTWDSFQEKPPRPKEPPAPVPAKRPDPLPQPGLFVDPGPARAAAPRIGRNDPCPCGSGKKFKKCCGARR